MTESTAPAEAGCVAFCMTDARFTDTWACGVTGLHRTTIARMRRRGRLRPELTRLAAIELDGVLGLIHADWSGWRLCRQTGALITPGGTGFAAGEILAMPLRYQELRALRTEVERMRRCTSDAEGERVAAALRVVIGELEAIAVAARCWRQPLAPADRAVERD